MGHFLSRLKQTKAGFTLIELLVVIAIIAVLSTIGLSAFTSAQQRARDARRRGDLKAMSDAFEQYYTASGGVYDATCSNMAKTPAGVVPAVNYLQGGILPLDPKNVAPNVYTNTCTATSYCLCALLESSTTAGNSTSTNCANFAAAGQYFCVRNLQ